MNRFILDSSIALAWCFEDETSPTADGILDLLESGQATVPAIWPAEVGNALLVGERRKRINRVGVSRSLNLLRSLNIRVDDADVQKQVDDWIDVAREHKLAVYDAAYLALALSHGMPLATLDHALVRAASAAGVEILQG